MRFALAFIFLLLADAPAPQPAVPYFSNVREIFVRASGALNYVVLDEQVYKYARHDLGDLRLYAGDREIPYAISVQRASSGVADRPARLLDLGSVGGTTQFLIDTEGVPEYDRVTLDLTNDAKNFIARAAVEGSNDDRHGPWTRLGVFTLYDFSREKLGCNSALRLPTTRLRYLRVNVSGLAPQQIAAAKIAMVAQQHARWTELSAQPRIEQSGRNTVITWDTNENVPLERIAFSVDPSEVNFRRPVEVTTRRADDKREATIAQGSISRVHISRAGRVVNSEELAIDLSERASNYKITIRNGDDPPLRIVKVEPMTLERRLYFDVKDANSLRLYYGDPKLPAPSYDFAKFFQQNVGGVRVDLGPDAHNAAYHGRPDDRPWSERHGWVMWAALVVAIVGLGSVALRGLKANAQP